MYLRKPNMWGRSYSFTRLHYTGELVLIKSIYRKLFEEGVARNTLFLSILAKWAT